MKIALLLSGELGTFEFKNTCEKWKKVINKLELDVFCIVDENNFYDKDSDCQIFSVNNPNKEMPNQHNRVYKNTKFLTYEESLAKINKILEKYIKVKSKKIFKYTDLNLNFLIKNKNHKIFYEYSKNTGRSINIKYANLSQFYKLKKCFDLMSEYENKNNFKYDLVIRSRFDIFIDNLNLITSNCKLFNQEICASYGTGHLIDWWAIGKRDIMEKYCNYYNNFAPGLLKNFKFFIYRNKEGKFLKFEKGYDIKKDNTLDICEEISDANEVGLSYIIEEIEKYKIVNYGFILEDSRYYI